MEENQEVEFKVMWKDEWLEWICGFANTTGGILYIGIDDNGKIVGLGNKAEVLLEKLPGKIKDSLGIISEVNLEENEGLKYLKIKINKYPIPISYHGKFYLRSGKTNREASETEYERLVLQRFGTTWDEMEVPNVKIEELDEFSIKKFKELAVKNKRLKDEDINIDNKSLLENLRLYRNGHLTTSAVLLFHNDPEKWFSGAYTKIGFFENDDADLRYQDEVHGSLIKQAVDIIDILYAKYLKAYIYFEGMQRIDEYILPDIAIREIVYNMLQHRLYSLNIPNQIKVYNDKIIFWNPGEIPEKIENTLFEFHMSSPRNMLISQTFFKAGFVESWGTGIRRIVDSCQKNKSPIPKITNKMNGVLVECNASEKYIKAMSKDNDPINDPINDLIIKSGKPLVKARIDTLMYTSEKSKDDPINDPINIGNLNTIQLKIIECLKNNNQITRKELSYKLHVSDATIKRAFSELKKMGIIERIGANKNGYWKINL